MRINYVRHGEGKPLLLIHGLGGTWRSWRTILQPLAEQRRVVAIDLPGFGKSPVLEGEVSIGTMCDAVALFLQEHDLVGVDAAGYSVGALLILEMARRRGVLGAVVSLGPIGFWAGWERHVYLSSASCAWRLARALQFAMPAITAHGWSRRLILTGLSAQAATLSPAWVLEEMRNCASAPAFRLMLRSLAQGTPQEGAAAGSLPKPLVIGWGRLDRVCFPRQAVLAQRLFPDARLHWFERCGHYPHWDAPQETARLILETTAD